MLMPEARIVTCMSVSVVPGWKPNTRMPPCAMLQVDCSRQHGQPRLAGAIGAPTLQRTDRRTGGHVDDVALAPLHHAGQYGADGVIGADQVDLDVARPFVRSAVATMLIGSITPALLTRMSGWAESPGGLVHQALQRRSRTRRISMRKLLTLVARQCPARSAFCPRSARGARRQNDRRTCFCRAYAAAAPMPFVSRQNPTGPARSGIGATSHYRSVPVALRYWPLPSH